MSASTTATAPAQAGPNANQALWEKGDFTRIADTMRDSGEAFVAALNIEPGMRVLDVGCGDGTTALPMARRGAEVVGIDIARNLVDAGNRRAAKFGLRNVRFEQGDVTALTSVADGSVDLAVTCFGAMFAPRPEDAARELVRVTRSGGRIVMGNWIPGDPTLVAQILRISSAYSPPPPEGFVSPMRWGVETEVTERFGAAGIPAGNITFERATWTFRTASSPSSFLNAFRTYYGPTMNAFDAAMRAGRAEALWNELDALFTAQNRSGSVSVTEIPATFLKVTVVKP